MPNPASTSGRVDVASDGTALMHTTWIATYKTATAATVSAEMRPVAVSGPTTS